MYTTIIHPLRKALNLSMNEYCVMDTIYQLSNNTKYGGWCTKSKERISKDLDLSRRTIVYIINTLINKGLIERNKENDFLKPSDEIRLMFQDKQNWLIGNSKSKFISGKVDEKEGCAEIAQGVQKLRSGCAEIAQEGVQKLRDSYNNNIEVQREDTLKEEIFSFFKSKMGGAFSDEQKARSAERFVLLKSPNISTTSWKPLAESWILGEKPDTIRYEEPSKKYTEL